MPRIVKEIRIKAKGGAESILVDGEPLPFYVAGDSLRIEVDPSSGLSTVFVGILADRVTVDSTVAVAAAL